MRKISAPSILMVLLCLLFFASCGRDNEDAPSPEAEEPTAEYPVYAKPGLPEPEIPTPSEPTPENIIEVLDVLPTTELLTITSFDGYSFYGRLNMPGCYRPVSKLVIYVHGSGANTYYNRLYLPGIGVVNYFDPWAEMFVAEGVAFFTYNVRGVSITDDWPYREIDIEAYRLYLPHNSVMDIYHMISALRENSRLANAQVLLLGMSEGSIIAPLFVEKFPEMVDGLFLMGVPIDGMYDVIRWQTSGGPSMAWYRYHFEADDRGRISREAFYADLHGVIDSILGGSAFESIDVNNDGYIDEQDMVILIQDVVPHMTPAFADEMIAAIEREDDDWLAENYPVLLTSAWFREHIALRSNYELLPDLYLPIYIFHGMLDQNVYVRRVYDMYARFAELGQINLTIHTFSAHDHGLNIASMFYGELSDGRQAVINAILDF